MISGRYAASEAAESLWRVDSALSKIFFEARWMFGLCTTRGVFGHLGGWARLREDGSLVGELTVDPSSVDTGNRLRDHDLQKRFFLDSANYPVITFRAGEITTVGQSITGVGHLVVRGRSVDVPVCGIVRKNIDHLTVTGSATLDVRNFGWPTALGYIRRTLIVNAAVSLGRNE